MSVARLTAAAAVAVTALFVVVPAQAATPPPDSGTVFTGVAPTRVFDSRTTAKIPAHGSRSVAIPTGLVPADATAVVFNLTGTDPDGPTWLATGPGKQGTPTTSSLNLAAGETRANLVTVALGHGDSPGIWVAAGPNAADAIVDVAGYYSPSGGAKYTSLTPQRVLDTRNSAPLGQGGTVTLDLSSKVPAGATSVVFNLTGTDVTGPTFVTAYPDGAARPDASNVNLVPGKNTPNLVTVRVSADRKVALTNAWFSTDVVVDLAGYYSPDSTQAFYPLLPGRVLDTRNADGSPRDPLGSGETRTLNLYPWVPYGATAAVINMTGTDVTGDTVVTVWAHGGAQPGVSNLNLLPGQTSANAAIAPLPPFDQDRGININNLRGSLDAVVDLAGYFAPARPGCTSNCVLATGANDVGQAGDGTTDAGNRTDAKVYGLSGVTAIANTDQNGYALLGDGTAWTWGANDRGQLGISYAGNGEGPLGQRYFATVPTQILSNSTIKQIFPGMALTADGQVLTWGGNESLQLGNGNPDVNYFQTGVGTMLTDVTAISEYRNGSGGVTRYALKSNGTVWSWGDNTRSALGNHDVVGNSASPVQVFGLFGCTGLGARVVLCPPATEGGVQTLWRWGAIGSGQQDSPTQLPLDGITGSIVSVQRDNGPNARTRAILSDGTVWQWPDNDAFTGAYVGAPVAGLSSVKALATGHALATDGTEWAFADLSAPVRTGVAAIGDGSSYVSAN
ncbi:hypothetical protein [Kutzneria sp. NPDC051319]|uniref:RCC1 domain-containing protein n=1 Tax=Kutzneria sp. NPDC051319 TaxID=3155047 RepID=UPI003435984E